jgi:DNA-directed RNA polymerase subunit M/transcription elongation factor TFIIS
MKILLKINKWNNIKIGSSVFTCSKCKKSKWYVSQKQTRVGDEPPTTFIEYLECLYVFKFYLTKIYNYKI